MRDETGLRRQWCLLSTLSSRRSGLTIAEMAEEAGVTHRTIRRDLDLFRHAGFPLDESVGEFGRKSWTLKGGRELPPLSFTFDEALALALGRRMLGPLDGTPFGDAAAQAYRKVRSVLGSKAVQHVERFASLFHETGAGRRGYAAKSDLIDAIRTAMEDGRIAQVLYRSERAEAATVRHVHPYGLVLHRDALYLVALDPSAGLVKHYKLDRISDVEVGEPAPPRPDGFDLDAYMASAFAVYRDDGEPIEVEVRFGASAARYVGESRWHPTQQLEPQADGSVVARYLVRGTAEIKSWVLGFGSKAVVLGPDSLRQEIIRDVQALATAYASTPEMGPAALVQEPPARPDPRHRRATPATKNGES